MGLLALDVNRAKKTADKRDYEAATDRLLFWVTHKEGLGSLPYQAGKLLVA